MKKLLLILMIPFSLFSQSTLIFSEYGEGSSNNKWLEIYNPSFMNVILDDYLMSIYSIIIYIKIKC